MNWALLLGVTHITCGAAIILLCIPLLTGRVKRNSLYGVRLAESLRTDDAWRRINRYGAKRLMMWSCLLALFGVAVLFMTLSSVWAIVLVAMAPVALAIPVLEIVHFARSFGAAEASSAGTR